MKHLLMITEGFPPAFAPRAGYLCKWISQNSDWRITVVHATTGDSKNHPDVFKHLTGFADDEFTYISDDGVHGLSLLSGLKNFILGKTSFKVFVRWFISKIKYFIFHESTQFSAAEAINSALKKNRFDLILCCHAAGSLFVVADKAAKKVGLPIIQDIRDIAEEHLQYKPCLDWRDKRYLTKRTKVYDRADCVVTVTKLLASTLQSYSKKLSPLVVYNGYDPDIFHAVSATEMSSFGIVYIGSVYRQHSHRQMEVFFDGFKLFVAKHNSKAITMNFYCTNATYTDNFLPMISQDIESVCRHCKPVQQFDLLDILSKASVLLVMGVQSEGKIGGVPSKLFEYLAVNRPILESIYNDDSEEEEIVRDSQAGAVCNTPESVCAFLESKYLEWAANGFVKGTTDRQYAERFSRASEANEYLNIIEHVLGKNQKILRK